MACPICSGVMEYCFTAMVLSKYQAIYEVCNKCGFLRAHEPHWIDEAYSRAIAAADTGLVMRNIALGRKLAAVLYWIVGERGKGRYLDVAGPPSEDSGPGSGVVRALAAAPSEASARWSPSRPAAGQIAPDLRTSPRALWLTAMSPS